MGCIFSAPELHQLVEANDSEAIVALLAKFTDKEVLQQCVNALFLDKTALWNACTVKNNVKVVQILLDHMADCSIICDQGNSTALMSAAFCGHDQVAQVLCNNPANKVDEQTRDGRTALICACYANNPDCIQVLLNANANVNLTHGWEHGSGTALHVAARDGKSGLVNTLLKANSIDVNVLDYGNNTALISACVAAGEAIGHNEDPENQVIRGAKMIDIQPYYTVIKALVRAGTDLTFENHVGVTALNCHRKVVEIVQYAIKHPVSSLSQAGSRVSGNYTEDNTSNGKVAETDKVIKSTSVNNLLIKLVEKGDKK